MTKDKHPNEALRYHRLLRGWSQQKVADEIGASNEMISKWEGGQKKTSSFYQEKLCALFGMNAAELGFLLPADDTPSSVPPAQEAPDNLNLPMTNGEKSQKEIIHILQEQLPFSLSTEQVELLSLLDQRDNEMTFNSSKRDTLRKIATAFTIGPLAITDLEPWERLSMAQQASSPSSLLNATTLEHFQQLLETGWELSNAGELHIAEQVLLSFLPRIKQLAPYQQEVASIAAEGLRLHGILAAHQQRLGDKLTICLQAVEYARQTKNLDILVAQLSELAIAFIYARQPANSFRTYQEALLYCEKEQISPLVRSRVYAAAAPTFAKNGYIKEACSFIQKAYDGFPTRLNNEPRAFSADNKPFMIDYYQGLLFLVMHQPKEAFGTFEKAVIHLTENQMPERWRLIILNYQGLASILSNQLEQYAKCLEEGVSCSITLGSKKRFDEAINIFQQYLPQTWHTEPRIKQISERFQLERQSRREEELEI